MQRKIDDPVEVGRRIRELRGIRTAKGVSRETGIPYSTYLCYETGKRNPSPKVREKLSAYFGVSEEFLFCTKR